VYCTLNNYLKVYINTTVEVNKISIKMKKLSKRLLTHISTFSRKYKLTSAWIATILIGLILSIFPGDLVSFIAYPFLLLWFITPYTVAKRKGKNPWKWTFLCVFFFPSWIILLSSNKESSVNKRSSARNKRSSARGKPKKEETSTPKIEKTATWKKVAVGAAALKGAQVAKNVMNPPSVYVKSKPHTYGDITETMKIVGVAPKGGSRYEINYIIEKVINKNNHTSATNGKITVTKSHRGFNIGPHQLDIRWN